MLALQSLDGVAPTWNLGAGGTLVAGNLPQLLLFPARFTFFLAPPYNVDDPGSAIGSVFLFLLLAFFFLFFLSFVLPSAEERGEGTGTTLGNVVASGAEEGGAKGPLFPLLH